MHAVVHATETGCHRANSAVMAAFSGTKIPQQVIVRTQHCSHDRVAPPRLQEVQALRLGLPLPPAEPLVDDTLAGERQGMLTDPDYASEGGFEGGPGTILPPPPSSTNRGLSPAAVGGIIAASVFVAAMSLGLALWFARAQGGRQAPDGTSSSRRSYLMGVECEKSEEGESVREFVKTALGRAAPKRKSSGHVGSTGSGVSSARSIATSSGHGRSDATAGGGVACPHVHPSHLPHCCSHGLVCRLLLQELVSLVCVLICR